MNKHSSSVTINTTNKSSPNYLPDNDDDEERRVKKKPRILSSMTGMVLQLAEVGIVKHNLGDYESAEQYFSQALSCVDNSRCCYLLSSRNNSEQFFGGKSVKTNTHHLQKEQLVYSANELSLPHHHQVSPSLSSAECSTTTENVFATTTTTTTTAKADSRIEYDEGMHVYKTILQINNPSRSQSMTDRNEEAIIPAILCYNIAQTYVQRKLYDVATTWFLQSLDRFAIVHALPRMNNNNGDINDGDDTKSSTLRIVKSLNCLGYCHYRLGNFRQAKVFYQRALFMISSSSSSGLRLRTSIHMAAAINCVAVVLLNDEESFDTNKTMEMFKESIEIYSNCLLQEEGGRKASSNKSPSTTDLMLSIATVLNNLGRIMFIRSEFIDAARSYEESLILRRELLGENSVDVAATTYNIGQTYQQLNRNDEALKLFEEFLNTITSVTAAAEQIADDGGGPAWKDTVLVYKGMAEIYQQKSDYRTALKYFNLVLKVQRRLVDAGDDDPNATTADIAGTLNKMGSLCYEMKNYKEALIHYEEGLKLEKSILEPNHQHIIITLTNIGHIYKHLGDYKKALEVYQLIDPMQQIASSSSETNNGGDNYNVDSLARAETMSSIGLMQYHLAEYDESFNSYQEALRIRRQHHHDNDDHSDIASTLNSIGLVLFKQYVYDLAKQCFNESLRIRSKLFGRDHRGVATLWYNIATIHFETGEDDIAIQMYKETLRVERISLGNDHPDVVLTLQHLGQVYQQVGQAEESLKYFQEAVAIERRRRHQSDATTVENNDGGGNNNNIQLSLARNLNFLGNIYLQLGMTTEMMECYVESSRIYEEYRSTSSEPEPGATVIIRGYSLYSLSKSNPPCAPKA